MNTKINFKHIILMLKKTVCEVEITEDLWSFIKH